MVRWLGNHGSVGAARRAARQDREQDETGSPAGSPYHVGVKGPTEIHRNEVIEDSVSVTVLSNIRPQRRRGAPKARPSVACGFYTFPGTRPAGSLLPLETSACQLMTICVDCLFPTPKFIPCRFLPLITRFFHSRRNFLLDVEGYSYTNFIRRQINGKDQNL